jgi:hypothetical protein
MSGLFVAPQGVLQKRYEALRCFFVEGRTAQWIASTYNYTIPTVYSLIRDFKKNVQNDKNWVADYFFKIPIAGRKISESSNEIKSRIIALRKQFLSVPDIKHALDSKEQTVSETFIYETLIAEGFTRLPRRDRIERESIVITEKTLEATKAKNLTYKAESFTSASAGTLVFLPYIVRYGLDKIINESLYPGTSQISKLSSILAFLALKLSNVRRYTADDMWCMDRGLGLFAGLNVLPKTAWFTSYSSRITRNMNLHFLKSMATVWQKHGLLSDTANLDFVAVPYWGNEEHLEKNWSGSRHQALTSVLAALAEDPDSGIITYGDATLRHENEYETAVEFLDFYKKSGSGDIKYLVFDSKFTTYENLKKLDENKVNFITIRRRSKNIVDDIEAIDAKLWKKVKVPMAKGKFRYLKVYEQNITIKLYGKEMRQIAITGHGKIKPALIITNDFELSQADIIRKYAKRWLVEKTISEQTHFFHLNRLSSSMVIKVDFDLTMTIFAHNLYRLLAKDLEGFTNYTSQTLYDKFICNSGSVNCNKDNVTVRLKKKRNLPCLLEAMQIESHDICIPWLQNKKIRFAGASTS